MPPWGKYQASTAEAAPKPWDKYKPEPPKVAAAPAPEPEAPPDTRAEAGLQGFGQGGTLGYLPHLQAAFGHGVEKANEMLGGEEATPYEDLKRHFQNRDAALKEQNPVITGAGNVTGAVMTLPMGGAAKGAGIAAKVGRAALTGAAYGGLANPDVESTDSDPYAELKARLINTGIGGLAGGGTEGLIAKTGQALAKGGQRYADKAVVKQIGANAGQIKKILQKDELPKIGEFLGSEGLMRPGKNMHDVAEHTANILETDGPKIAAMYEDAQRLATASNSGQTTMAAIGKLDGDTLANEIAAKVKANAKNHPDRNLVSKTIDDAVAPLRDMGPDANIMDLHDFRKGLDENINWGAKTEERGAVQRAFIDARNAVADATKKQIDALDKMLGGNRLEELKAINKRYSTASTVNNIATQGAARETAKAFMGHGVIGGGAGVLGGGIEYERSHDPVKAMGAALASALGVTAARKFGAPVGYYGGKAVSAAGRGIQALTPDAGRVGAGAAAPWLLMGGQ